MPEFDITLQMLVDLHRPLRKQSDGKMLTIYGVLSHYFNPGNKESFQESFPITWMRLRDKYVAKV